MIWIPESPRAQLVTTASGKVRDVSGSINLFMQKKFGMRWLQRLRAGEVPREEINAAYPDFKAMLAKLKDDTTEGDSNGKA